MKPKIFQIVLIAIQTVAFLLASVDYAKHTLFQDTDDAFTVRVVEKPEEVKSLLESGFEYVCQKDNLIFLRKRK